VEFLPRKFPAPRKAPAPRAFESRVRLAEDGEIEPLKSKMVVNCNKELMTEKGKAKAPANGSIIGFKRITSDPARMNGEPCIRDLRLTVRRVLEALALYPDRAELKREYPELEDEDIQQALEFAAALVDDKVLPLSQAR
jgi:uncharacterized protein (DUF433 family)